MLTLHHLLDQAKAKEAELEKLRLQALDRLNTAVRRKRQSPKFPNEIWSRIFSFMLSSPAGCPLASKHIKNMEGYLFNSEFLVQCGKFRSKALRTLLRNSAPAKLSVSVGSMDESDAEKSLKQFSIALGHGSRWVSLGVSGSSHAPCDLFKQYPKKPKITSLSIPSRHIFCFSGHIAHLRALSITVSFPDDVTSNFPTLLTQTPLLRTLAVLCNLLVNPIEIADCYSDFQIPYLTTFHPSFSWNEDGLEISEELIICISKCASNVQSLILDTDRDDGQRPSEEEVVDFFKSCSRNLPALQELSFWTGSNMSEVESWFLSSLISCDKKTLFSRLHSLAIKLDDGPKNWPLLKSVVQARYVAPTVSQLNTLEVTCSADDARELDMVRILHLYVPNLYFELVQPRKYDDLLIPFDPDPLLTFFDFPFELP